MKEVGIWLQLNKKGNVKIDYWLEDQKKSSARSEMAETSGDNYFVARIILDSLDPGKKYYYSVSIDGNEVNFNYELKFQTQSLWQYRTDPPEFSFSLGSCLYDNEPEVDRPGKAYGGEYKILESIYQKNTDFMLWLGDNTYLREVDWNTRSGIYHRYSHSRAVKEMQALLANTHHYAIWDDHDYGPNNSDKSYWNKTITEEAFNDFWINPNTNLTGEGGITSTFFLE